jgi:2-dehydro-3-deoxy-L-rhamnonate dehydrogenase (NAD+)
VTIWDMDAAPAHAAAAALPGSAVVADVSDFAAVTRAVQETLEAAAAIDILINNAGITGPNDTLWDYPVEAWAKVFAINVHGVFHCCRAVVPLMRARDYGRIVNIASVAGKEGNPNASAYSASKAAVIGLTKSLGKELADTGIRVNCVTPAAVRTPLFAQMTQAHIDYMLGKIPLGRFGETHEVAALVAWLASEECSFSTGAVFDLSGGRSTY